MNNLQNLVLNQGFTKLSNYETYLANYNKYKGKPGSEFLSPTTEGVLAAKNQQMAWPGAAIGATVGGLGLGYLGNKLIGYPGSAQNFTTGVGGILGAGIGGVAGYHGGKALGGASDWMRRKMHGQEALDADANRMRAFTLANIENPSHWSGSPGGSGFGFSPSSIFGSGINVNTGGGTYSWNPSNPLSLGYEKKEEDWAESIRRKRRERREQDRQEELREALHDKAMNEARGLAQI